MNGKYLLDTNIVIALFANDASVKQQIIQAREVSIPATVIGELFYGAFKSGRSKANIAKLEGFATANTIIGSGLETGKQYGKIKHRLRKKGTPIPENDIWIAAIAMEHDLTLVSRDEHFTKVVDLKRVFW